MQQARLIVARKARRGAEMDGGVVVRLYVSDLVHAVWRSMKEGSLA